MTLANFLQATSTARTPTELWGATRDHFRGLGFLRISYHHYGAGWMTGKADAQVTIRTDGFPEEWMCEYLENRLYLIDPIPETAAQTTDPFLWSNVSKMRRLGTAQTAYLKRLAQTDLGDGLAVQVFGPGMRNGYVGLGFGTSDVPIFTQEDLREVQYAAQIAHLAYCRLNDDVLSTQRDLSPREREVLEWIARGKSNSVIGEIMGLSRHTIDTLVRRLFDKLGVTDRTTAAITALGSGLILPKGN